MGCKKRTRIYAGTCVRVRVSACMYVRVCNYRRKFLQLSINLYKQLQCLFCMFAISGSRSQSQSDQREYKFSSCSLGIFRNFGVDLRDGRTDTLLEAVL